MLVSDLFSSKDSCPVCGQTPCNCTHVAESQLNEFAPGSGDDGEPNEEILRKLAAQWWSGTEQQMARAQQALEAMGWEIGPDESGDDDAGVYVYRIGDDDGRDTIAFGHSELSLDEAKDLNEFAPDDGGESRKFIPWNEFVDQLKQILHKDFDCKESINMDVIKAKFVPYDPMEYGPTQIYSYFERRAGRKGANSVRGQIQVGNFFKGSKPGDNQLMTGYHLLKGTEFERYFDLTFDNLYKIANIIKGNTEGALESPQGVAEDASNVGNAIKSLYQKIYAAGDDEIEYFYNDSPIFAQYWDEYEGDLDSIIAEVDPSELQVILDELESYVQNANLAEGSEEVDTHGRTKAEWVEAVHAKYPMARVIHNKDNTQVMAVLPNGKEIRWIKDESIIEQGIAEAGFTKTPSGDYINQHTGVRSSKPPVKKKRGEKTGAEWDAIEKAKKDKDQGVAEGDKKPEPPEADYGPEYQDMVARVKKLAGLGPMKTVYDPKKRVYRNMPTAVQPKK